jgi:transcriptional regulator with XRE-family HTH domain
MRANAHTSKAAPRHKTKAQLAKHLGAVAREARHGLGLTQEDVAERLGVAAEVYARMERGQALPRVTNLRKLCFVLRVDAGALLGTAGGGEPVPPPGPTFESATEASDSAPLRRLLRNARTLPDHALMLLCQMARALRGRHPSPPSA